MNYRSLKLIRGCSLDPCFNLAWEEYCLHTREKGEKIILLWQNSDSVVLGRYQNAFLEVDFDYAMANDISLVRRKTGGGAVFHDEGNLNVSFIGDSEDENFASNAMEDTCAVLRNLGVDVRIDGRNDLTVCDSKIAGFASIKTDQSFLCHGSILVSCNTDRLNRVLTRNGKIIDSMSVKSNRRVVKNLSDWYSNDLITVNDVVDSFEKYYCSRCTIVSGTEKGKLSSFLERGISFYSDAKWTFGFRPEYNYMCSRSFPSGNIVLNLVIKSGKVSSALFSGDFFSDCDVNAFEQSLVGCSCMADISDIFDTLGEQKLISGIDNFELLRMFEEIMRYENYV